MQEAIFSFFHTFSLEWWVLLGLLLGVWLILFGLGMVARGFISGIFFLLAFSLIIGSPFIVRYVSTKYLFATKLTYAKVAPMQFAESFFADVKIQNTGMRAIKGCVFTVAIRRSNKYLRYFDSFFPIRSYRHDIKTQIPPNASAHEVIIIDGYDEDLDTPYLTQLNCY